MEGACEPGLVGPIRQHVDVMCVMFGDTLLHSLFECSLTLIEMQHHRWCCLPPLLVGTQAPIQGCAQACVSEGRACLGERPTAPSVA